MRALSTRRMSVPDLQRLADCLGHAVAAASLLSLRPVTLGQIPSSMPTEPRPAQAGPNAPPANKETFHG